MLTAGKLKQAIVWLLTANQVKATHIWTQLQDKQEDERFDKLLELYEREMKK